MAQEITAAHRILLENMPFLSEDTLPPRLRRHACPSGRVSGKGYQVDQIAKLEPCLPEKVGATLCLSNR